MGHVHTHGYITRAELDELVSGITAQRDAYKAKHSDPVNVQKALADGLNKMGEKNPFLSQLTRQLSGIMGGLITPYLHDQAHLPYSFMLDMGSDVDGDVITQSLLSAKHIMEDRDEFTPNPKYATPYKVATANYRRKSFSSGVTAKSVADQLESLKESIV